ncbi:MAG: ABC transporter permease [Anaerovoracaceae bacterium]|jgi:peptide/nickel transport system permease protein
MSEIIGRKKRSAYPTLEVKFPTVPVCIVAVIAAACIFANVIAPYDVTDMDPGALSAAPGASHIFGTDTLGRDLFSMILFGGRYSLLIGILATLISTFIAVVYGCLSGLLPRIVDDIMMRFAELMLSIPSILLIIFLQAMMGDPTVISISVVIGITSWMNISKIVRSEVRQIRNTDYVLASRIMGGGFFYVLRKHLAPNFVPAIMYMVVSNIGSAIITEATLSFMGLGLPLTQVSWGSLMSMSQEVLTTGCWWIIILPGLFLVTTQVCITDIGDYIRRKSSRLFSNL